MSEYQRIVRITGTRAVSAEGARVALASCLDCGAALLLDPDDARHGINVVEIHRLWHVSQDES